MRFPKKLGVTLLSAFLVLTGLNLRLDLPFQGYPILVGAIAIAAGVLLFLDR